jgi:NRAMP (natural resistance-associated macrophage protein)-like metal ion transporter
MAAKQEDPILDALTPGAGGPPDPQQGELLKDPLAPGGSPRAGRTTVEEALQKSPTGLLQLLGPGLITGASDDDPSGIGTYSQVGSQFGYGLLWTALFTFPLMAAVQELCGRIALQTQLGLGAALRRKFPAWIVAPAILGLVVANTINLGADLGAVAAGVELLSRGWLRAAYLALPIGAGILLFQLASSYNVIFRTFKWLTLALFAYLVAVFISHPKLGELLVATVVPHVEFSRDFITAIVAILGTTISPYLFFWQASSEVDELESASPRGWRRRKGVSTAELRAARLDIVIGMGFSQLIMYCIILTNAAVLNAHGRTNIQTAQDAAAALGPLVGPFAVVLFSLGLIGTGLLAIPILSGSATYAVKEFLGLPGNLATKPRYRPTFYSIMAITIVLGTGMNYLQIDVIRALFVTAVINGIVAPPLMVLIVLLGSDRRWMKDRVSGRISKALTWVATAAMGAAAATLIITTFVH